MKYISIAKQKALYLYQYLKHLLIWYGLKLRDWYKTPPTEKELVYMRFLYSGAAYITAFCFIEWSVNISDWSYLGRFLCAMFTLVTGALLNGWIFPDVYKDND